MKLARATPAASCLLCCIHPAALLHAVDLESTPPSTFLAQMETHMNARVLNTRTPGGLPQPSWQERASHSALQDGRDYPGASRQSQNVNLQSCTSSPVSFLFFILHSPLNCGAPSRSDLSSVLLTPPEIFRSLFPPQKWRGLIYSWCSAGPALTISPALIFSSPGKQNTNQAVIIVITLLEEVASRLRLRVNGRKGGGGGEGGCHMFV